MIPLVFLAAVCGALGMIVAVPGFIVGVVFLILRGHQQVNTAWEAFARSTRMTFNSGGTLGYPKVSGDYQGTLVALSVYVSGSGRHATYYTQLTAAVKTAAGNSLSVYREGVVGWLDKALGGQDVQVGNEAFDLGYVVKSQPPDLAQRTLNSAVCGAMLELGVRSMSLKEGRLQLYLLGVETKQETLTAFLEAARIVADSLTIWAG